jgi:hypothetical protein
MNNIYLLILFTINIIFIFNNHKNNLLYICIVLLLWLLIKNNKQENLNTSVINDIPTNVFLTFITDGDFDMPPDMEETLLDNKKNNPEFNFNVFKNKTCQEFIKIHFGQNILNVYNGLKPGAYKSDLIRYCLLYINGGVYMDVKLKLHIKLKELINKYNEVYVKDPDWYPDSCKRGCNNAFIITRKNNPIFLECIKQIEINYNSRYYGNNFLYPTGPCLLGYIIRSKYDHIKYNLKISKENKHSSFDIVDENNDIIVSSYANYRDELKLFPGTTHYGELWNKKDIYINNENFDPLHNHTNIEYIKLDTFNNIFNINIIKLPKLTALFGFINNKYYISINDNNHIQKLKYVITYWINNISSSINTNSYYFLLCYNDGYRSNINNLNNNIFMDYITTINDSNIENNLKNINIVTFSKYINDNTICIPDFHYIKSNGYKNIIKLIDNNFVDWNNKINKCVWRGSHSSDLYYNFIDYQNREGVKNILYLDDIDIYITNGPRNYFIDLYNKSKFINIDYKSNYLSIENQLKYKYILDIDGWACTWDATFWKLYSGSVLLKQKSVWKQWYYDELIEYVHYVPFANDFSDLNEQIQWCINNDDKCQEIINNSRKFVLDKLNWNQVQNDIINKFNYIL